MNKKDWEDIGQKQIPIILTNVELNTLLAAAEFRVGDLKDKFFAKGFDINRAAEGIILVGAIDKITSSLGENTYHKIADRVVHEN